MTHRIVLVDDHPLFRVGLREMLEVEDDLEVVGQAADVEAALRVVAEANPDLVLVDITLPGDSGLDLVRRLRQDGSGFDPGLRVVVLSMHDEGVYGARALDVGAQGYLSKRAGADEIVRGVRTVLGGQLYFRPGLLEAALRKRPEGRAGLQSLTARELEVFEHIAQGLSTKEIAHALSVSIKTVESHRANMRRKLGLADGGRLNRYAHAWWLEQHGTSDAS